MQNDNVVQMVTLETMPTVHKFSVFLIANLAAFGAQLLVQKGYVAGYSAYRKHQATLTK